MSTASRKPPSTEEDGGSDGGEKGARPPPLQVTELRHGWSWFLPARVVLDLSVRVVRIPCGLCRYENWSLLTVAGRETGAIASSISSRVVEAICVITVDAVGDNEDDLIRGRGETGWESKAYVAE